MRSQIRATAEDVLTLLREIVAELGPDFIYQAETTWWPEVAGWRAWPRYFRTDGTPDDIAGRILAGRGFCPEDVIEFVPVGSRLIPHQPWFLGFDPLARVLLFEAQRQQDLGSTYGYVLERVEWLFAEICRLVLEALTLTEILDEG